jgi:septal ring factor EnvC (AmiA/AmiB activator)
LDQAESKRLASLEQEVARQGTGQEAMVRTLERLEEALQRIQSQINQPPPSTNWLGVGALLLAACGVMGSLGAFALSPVKEETRDLRNVQQSQASILLERAEQISSNTERTNYLAAWAEDIEDDHEKAVSDLANARERVSRLEGLSFDNSDRVKILEDYARDSRYSDGQLKELKRELEAIDQLGSRRWNKDKSQ